MTDNKDTHYDDPLVPLHFGNSHKWGDADQRIKDFVKEEIMRQGYTAGLSK